MVFAAQTAIYVLKGQDFSRAVNGPIELGFIESCLSNVLLGAPEAQCLLAPRFSVGNADRADEPRSPVGTAQGHFFCRDQ